jgi:Fe-S oxidoreductase
MKEKREGSLGAPTRHPLNWKDPDFYNEDALYQELERVYDICHGCRRCVMLCKSFPTLFDLVDESSTMEVDGVAKQDYWKVIDHCYLCDLCYMTKCPYVPPHEWNVDFPHLMLRGKAIKHQKGDIKFRDKVLTSTDSVGKLASTPVVSQIVNTANKIPAARKVLDVVLGVHPDAVIPVYESNTLRKRMKSRPAKEISAVATSKTKGKVVLFTTCYGNYNEPHLGEDLLAIFEHNDIAVTLASKERCCGMPKLELGDLKAVEQAKNDNIAELEKLVDDGWDIVAPIPSCVLMFKQELPLMFPDDAAVAKVKEAIFDPFEYLMLRHKEGKLKTDFKTPLGNISYHVACHQRVQNIGLKTRDLLQLVPDTTIDTIERCSGHDGTYAVKTEFHKASMKIAAPVIDRVRKAGPDYYSSDCPMAGHQIENGLEGNKTPTHPLTLIRIAYGL